jgi:hypothetical protein
MDNRTYSVEPIICIPSENSKNIYSHKNKKHSKIKSTPLSHVHEKLRTTAIKFGTETKKTIKTIVFVAHKIALLPNTQTSL